MPALITGSSPPALDEPAFRRALRRAIRWPPLALGTILAILLTLTLLSMRAAEWVTHTNRVLAQAFAAENLVVDMQSALRAYQLTGDAHFLDPQQSAQLRVEPAFDKLSAFVADNAAQRTAVMGVRADFLLWQAHGQETLERVRSGGDVRDVAWNTREKQLFDNFRERMERFVNDEEQLRAERVGMLAAFRNAVLVTLGLAALLGIPLLARTMQRVVQRVSDAYHGALANTASQRDELHTLLRSIGDAVLATNESGRISFLNPVAERLTGWSDGEARGRSVAEVLPIFHEETGAPADNPVARVLREGAVVGLAQHTVLRPRGGGEIPIEDSAAPIFSADGSVRGVIMVFHDVREKHAREQAQREAEWLARTALEVGGGSAWVLDIPRGVMVGDETLARTFNVPLEQCRAGEPLATFIAAIHAEDRQRVETAISRSLGAGEPYHIEYRVIGADGALRWVESAGRLERDANGRPARLPGVFFDITARKEAEQALIATKERAEELARVAAEGAERFRLLAETVSLQVWTATPDGGLDWANHYVANFFGKIDLQRDVLGTAWTRLVHPDDLPSAGKLWAHSLATGERYETEFRLLRGDGEYRWFLVRAEAMRSNTEGVIKWFGTNTDIHALKTAQTDAEAAARAKDNFLAALSHELRTPLTPVLMTAASLRDDHRLPIDAREQLGMMERNIALEARLIDDLLDLTRITQGKLPLRPQLCDAHSLIGLAVEIVRDDAQAKGIAIERAFDAGSSGLMVDPARFQQVIWNLLRNSVKFTPEYGRISIRTSNTVALKNAMGSALGLRVEVRDSGVGIDADAIDRIFRPFEQAGYSGDHRFGGLGLGLAIARAIVDLHGGTIRAESGGSGMGATFIIDLPDATAAPTGGVEMLHHHDSPSEKSSNGNVAKSLRLLLVEDHPATLEVLTRLLKRAGHNVVATGSVTAALHAADADSFDAVVSDLGLPDGTGNELMAQLRDRHGLRGIALTGYGMEQDMERSRESGFVAHLVKPVDFDQLRRTLDLIG